MKKYKGETEKDRINLKNDNTDQEPSKKGQCLKWYIWKKKTLQEPEKDRSEKDKSDQGLFWKVSLCKRRIPTRGTVKMTLLKRNHLNNDNSEKDISGKRRFWTVTILKKDNSGEKESEKGPIWKGIVWKETILNTKNMKT